MAARHARSTGLGNRFHRGSRLSGAAMMVRPPRVPADLQAQTRFVKERVERAIAELEQIVQQTDPVFVSPRDVTLNLWLAEREWPRARRGPFRRRIPRLSAQEPVLHRRGRLSRR